MYVYRTALLADDGALLGEFSSHWAACVAMIRVSDPDFQSLGGDRSKDLAEERKINERQPKKCEECGFYLADPPSRLCPACEAYQEHQR